MPATICSWTLLLRLAMPAAGAVEELVMLATILLVLRLAMPATGASHASFLGSCQVLVLRLAMPATGAIEEPATLATILLVLKLAMPVTGASHASFLGSCQVLVLRLVMPATGAIEEPAMLATILLLVLRLAMPATGQLRTLLWDLALSATVCSCNWLWLGTAITDGHASSWSVLVLSRVLLLRRAMPTKITCLSEACGREFLG